MIDKDEMRYGLKVLIIADDDNWGEVGFVEAESSNNNYYVIVPGIERYFEYKLEDLVNAGMV